MMNMCENLSSRRKLLLGTEPWYLRDGIKTFGKVSLSDNKLTMPLATSGAAAQTAFATRPHAKDPYKYQVGFGNLFASEALYVMPYLWTLDFVRSVLSLGQAFFPTDRIVHKRTSIVFTMRG